MDSPGDAKYGMTKPQMFQAYRILMEKGAKEFGCLLYTSRCV